MTREYFSLCVQSKQRQALSGLFRPYSTIDLENTLAICTRYEDMDSLGKLVERKELLGQAVVSIFRGSVEQR
jgi:hypothetical protein